LRRHSPLRGFARSTIKATTISPKRRRSHTVEAPLDCRNDAEVLLAVHKRKPVRLSLEGVRDAVWEPKTTFAKVKRRVAKVLVAVRERGDG